MEKSNQVFESIFSRKLEDTSTKHYLENITGEHPYFSPAQFYLLLQTKEDDLVYQQLVQKNAALFNNNYWLNYLMLQPGITDTNFITPDFTAQETIAEQAFNDLQAPVLSQESQLTNIAVTTPDIEGEDPEVAVAPQEPVIQTSKYLIGEKIIEKPVDEQHLTANNPTEKEKIESGIIADNETEFPEETEDEINNTDQPIPNIKINIPGPGAIKEDTLLFQPLHTSDYFASVGIKLSDEVNPSDRLGKQLKSFTQWLKTMKRIDGAPTEPVAAADTTTESTHKNIQSLAEKSNKENEVITEAMADVLVQQGRNDKAIEVLKKLSLLNPAKSPYFAAKIDQIKQ